MLESLYTEFRSGIHLDIQIPKLHMGVRTVTRIARIGRHASRTIASDDRYALRSASS